MRHHCSSTCVIWHRREPISKLLPRLQVSFTPKLNGDSVKPQQAMLMAASKSHPGLAAYAVAKVKKDGPHIITLTTASIDKQLANVVRWYKPSRLLCGQQLAILHVTCAPVAAADAAAQN
eukprot:GHUV01011176.1.p1 GENE.GHUV01011176.1~~GHUV01011176.1.p1  ORF type:complete len:120 (+),score=38.38 GHUV01011176.1:596-955(+)